MKPCTMRAALATGLLAIPGAAAWALGPAAPFLPPRAAAGAHLEAAAAAAASSATSSTPLAGAGSGLGGMRLGTTAMALIDDQWWPVGSRPRGALLVAVNAHGAWLRHADGRIEHLSLHVAADGTRARLANAGASPAAVPVPPLPALAPQPPHRPPPSTRPPPATP